MYRTLPCWGFLFTCFRCWEAKRQRGTCCVSWASPLPLRHWPSCWPEAEVKMGWSAAGGVGSCPATTAYLFCFLLRWLRFFSFCGTYLPFAPFCAGESQLWSWPKFLLSPRKTNCFYIYTLFDEIVLEPEFPVADFFLSSIGRKFCLNTPIYIYSSSSFTMFVSRYRYLPT